MKGIKSPKQRKKTETFRDHWYPYYAGFSSDFVSSVLDKHTDKEINFILDPWNGSGTTTTVASSKNIKSVGIDINPVMTIVAKARNLSHFDIIRSKAMALDTIANFIAVEVDQEALIRKWYSDKSSSFYKGLIDSLSKASGFSREEIFIGEVDRPTAAILLCIFILAKSQTSSIKTKNPTWTRQVLEEKIDIDHKSSLIEFSRLISEKISSSLFRHVDQNVATVIFTGRSESLSYKDNFFDMVIGSPPYATRIDYSVKTALELALLGYSNQNFEDVRKNFMGTTSINNSIEGEVSNVEISKILDKIYNHYSKASKSYYYKTYKDYFSKLEMSIKDICRVVNKEGDIYLVVQGSNYKELFIDLPGIVEYMLVDYGFKDVQKVGFADPKTMQNISPTSMKYRKSSIPIEYVVHARRKNV